jgi:hypothetical protein
LGGGCQGYDGKKVTMAVLITIARPVGKKNHGYDAEVIEG